MVAKKRPLHYRLGLDVGTGSLGWAVLELSPETNEPIGLIRAGSRIFGTGRSPKDNSTFAANRRDARSARRRRDRFLQRQRKTLNTLVRYGLMPEDYAERQALKTYHPFKLRYRAIREELTPYELGRALFHLQQRRGFKSNRKADKGDSDTGAMKSAIRDFSDKLGNDETVGSFLWQEIQQGNTARTKRTGEGAKASYNFYVERAMVEEEFDRIWELQRAFNPSLLTVDARNEIKDAIFHQRPLRAVEAGKCFLEPKEQRAPKALPSSQLLRIYQEVNNLRYTDTEDPQRRKRALTAQERDKAVDILMSKAKIKLVSLKTSIFGRATTYEFSLERGERADINGDSTGVQMSKKEAFGEIWKTLPLSEQDDIILALLDLESEEQADELKDVLSSRYPITPEQAEWIVDRSKLVDGYGRLSRAAAHKLLPHLVDDWDDANNAPVTYAQAVISAGYAHHSISHTGTTYDELPYYGEVLWRYCADVPNATEDNTSEAERKYGRIANPTVHIGLNQIRKVVNALIRDYGKPYQVHIELARDLGQSDDDRRKASTARNENEKRNIAIDARLESLGVTKNRANRERLRLYEDLPPFARRCVLSGKAIALDELFSNAWHIDHILPFSRTLDDSYANKLLVSNEANSFKRNRTPAEAYGPGSPNYDPQTWDAILERAGNLAFNKSRRFAVDAMTGYTTADGGDFLARQLTDTAYLARATKQYLGALMDDPTAAAQNVVASPGRLTAMLRGKWGLNTILSHDGKKNRDDHRHHAIDAVVIACSSRSTLKKLTDANRRATDEQLGRLLADLEHPWPGFRSDVQEVIDRVVVSHKPDHNPAGRLHEETAYGVTDGPNKDGQYLTHQGDRRRPQNQKWRNVVPIYRPGEGPDSGAQPFKAYIGGSNYCIEIVRTDKGRWEGKVISTYFANQPAYRSFMADRKRFLKESYDGRPLVMRLMRDDTVMLEVDGVESVYRVCKMDSDGPIYFAEVRESNVADRSRNKEVAFSMLKKNSDPLRKLNARRIFVDELGNVLDPGFRE